MSVIGLPMVVFVPTYFIQEMGMAPALVGTLFLVGRTWDMVSDPLMGVLVDRVQSQWGKHKHWILVGTLPLALAGWGIFMPPEGSGAAYLLVFLLIAYTGYTLSIMTQLSWGTELASNYDERSRLFTWREFASLGSMITVLVVPILVGEFGGDWRDRYQSMGWYLLVILLPTTIWPLLVLPDRRSKRRTSPGWEYAIRTLISNSPLRIILSFDICLSLILAVVGTLFIPMCEYIFDARDSSYTLLLVYFTAGALGMPLWLRLATRYQKHRALQIAMAYQLLTGPPIIWACLTGNFLWFCVLICAQGISFGAAPAISRSLLADIVDVDELANHNRRSGLMFALHSMATKIGYALAPFLVWSTMQLVFDFQAAQTVTETTEWTRLGLILLFCSIPGLCSLVSIILMRHYRLDRQQHGEVLERLNEARSNQG